MVSKWYDVGFIVDVVLFDFDKAFNVVSHNLLLHRLRLLVICIPLIEWIANFLSGRFMRVLVSGIRRSDIRSGVPQLGERVRSAVISFFY